MADGPAYAILGRGRWARRMQSILAAENRSVLTIGETRQTSSESAASYRSRLAENLRESGAQIAWLCVLPGPHVTTMLDAALDAGLHVIVEKPWMGAPGATESIRARAESLGRLIAIHYEYCLLGEVARWRADFYPGAGLHFSGHFFLSRPDHTGMHALDNLGSHLLAIRAHAVPRSALREIRCCYEQADERCVWLERRNARAASINLLEHNEPIIQRFFQQFESAMTGVGFPFGLNFALRVANDVAGLR